MKCDLMCFWGKDIQFCLSFLLLKIFICWSLVGALIVSAHSSHDLMGSVSGELMMSLFWYYRPEHTQSGRDPSMHCEVSRCCYYSAHAQG